MKLKITIVILSVICFTNCKNKEEKVVESEKPFAQNTKEPLLKIHPIEHASTVVEYGNTTIYIDPTLGAEAYKTYGTPNFVVITDVHFDHLALETLKALDLNNSKIIAPKAVIDKLPDALVSKSILMNNGDLKTFDTFKIEALPMYNLREEALKFHEKGRGNGYVFTFGIERVYFSGDTEDIAEMRALKAIDKAFICMNSPYTMTVESAASAVLEFNPKEVYPYHYRGTDGFSDVKKFKRIVNTANPDIEVVLLDWYPQH
ncbi:MAG: MBL fold metallo-hydrolase [Algibacter sp.]|uniref:MBL fold metallo-hydrolase n=1 Tax=Algibacter sp. TaxID=1872428 RepID=UPI0026383337|nr:MBL fold metallo-hydrolase [Algibacter sp.]MDG1728706.1 MBL fold metallo-hydrolase [Algibacter sp.]MDG2178765.1 MBL fold metallo-hydrolase [Algibacter sp.]